MKGKRRVQVLVGGKYSNSIAENRQRQRLQRRPQSQRREGQSELRSLLAVEKSWVRVPDCAELLLFPTNTHAPACDLLT